MFVDVEKVWGVGGEQETPVIPHEPGAPDGGDVLVWPKNSCSLQMVVFQQPAQAFVTADCAATMISYFSCDWK
jgi:hypothetical protein